MDLLSFILGAILGGLMVYLVLRPLKATLRKPQETNESPKPLVENSPPAENANDEKALDLDAQRLAAAARIQDQRAASRALREAQRLADEVAAQERAQRVAHDEAQRVEAQRLADEVAAQERAQRLAEEESARLDAQRLAAEAAAQEKAQRLAQEDAQRVEAQRVAQEEAQRVEAQRLAQEEALRLEAQRVADELAAQEQAQRVAEADAQRVQEQRLAQEQALRLEAQRVADEVAAQEQAQRLAEADAQRVEEQRLAQEQALRLEAQRVADEVAAQEQAQRVAAEAAEQVATAEVLPPVEAKLKPPAETLVMIVDDSKVGRIKTNRVLLNSHYQVQMAVDGQDAVNKIAATMPDIVITDVEMPEMDGFELTAHIRKNPATAHLPVIIVSGSSEEYAVRAKEVGADFMLGKPYTDSDMIEHVQRLLLSRH